MRTSDAVPLLDQVQLLQLPQNVHTVVEEVDDDWDEHTKGEAPSGSCCCPAVGGVAAACQHRQPVEADKVARRILGVSAGGNREQPVRQSKVLPVRTLCVGGGGERRTVEDQQEHHEGRQVQKLAPALAGIRL